jgi:hypothetical protein
VSRAGPLFLNDDVDTRQAIAAVSRIHLRQTVKIDRSTHIEFDFSIARVKSHEANLKKGRLTMFTANRALTNPLMTL